MEKLTKACGTNINVHLTFARSGDINQLFFDKKDKKKPHLKDDLMGGGNKKMKTKRRRSR